MNPFEQGPFQYFNAVVLWVQAHPYLAWGSLVGLMLPKLVIRARRRAKRKHPDTHGSARFATKAEIDQSRLSHSHGVVIGAYNKEVLLDDSPLHIGLFAPTGGGKDTFHINPTLAWGWSESALILDPKRGQTFKKTEKYRLLVGNVEVFAPYTTPATCINILDMIRLGQPEEYGDALTIGQGHTAIEAIRRESSAGVHFRELAATTIAAASLHVRYTARGASLATVYKFLGQHKTFTQAMKAMEQAHHTSRGVHYAIAEMARSISRITNGEELSSVWSTTTRALSLYLDPYVEASTCRSTVNLEDLQYAAHPLSLYLLAKSTTELKRVYPVYRAILDMVFARLTEHEPQTYKHRLLFVANELPAYGYMESINRGATIWRDYGIKGLFIAQDIKQLEDIYGEQCELWSNTDLKLFHAQANDKSARRISENFLDKETVEYDVVSRQGTRVSVTPHRTGRALMTPSQVRQLHPSQLLVCMGGEPPFIVEKYGYDPRLAYTGTSPQEMP